MDQFGVLHDGKVAYPGSIEAVKALASAGKKVLIISNSSRRQYALWLTLAYFSSTRGSDTVK